MTVLEVVSVFGPVLTPPYGRRGVAWLGCAMRAGLQGTMCRLSSSRLGQSRPSPLACMYRAATFGSQCLVSELQQSESMTDMKKAKMVNTPSQDALITSWGLLVRTENDSRLVTAGNGHYTHNIKPSGRSDLVVLCRTNDVSVAGKEGQQVCKSKKKINPKQPYCPLSTRCRCYSSPDLPGQRSLNSAPSSPCPRVSKLQREACSPATVDPMLNSIQKLFGGRFTIIQD